MDQLPDFRSRGGGSGEVTCSSWEEDRSCSAVRSDNIFDSMTRLFWELISIMFLSREEEELPEGVGVLTGVPGEETKIKKAVNLVIYYATVASLFGNYLPKGVRGILLVSAAATSAFKEVAFREVLSFLSPSSEEEEFELEGGWLLAPEEERGAWALKEKDVAREETLDKTPAGSSLRRRSKSRARAPLAAVGVELRSRTWRMARIFRAVTDICLAGGWVWLDLVVEEASRLLLQSDI